MFAVFLAGATLYIRCFLKSWGSGRHQGAPLGLKRIIFLIFGFPLFCGTQCMHWIGFLCDEIFFPRFRQVEIKQPIFISGIPRSGTTFVHRTLASDPQFTSFTTWEAVLAPSITQRKILRAFAAADRLIGAPFKKSVDAITLKVVGDFNAIHEVGLDAPEEDYLALLPAGACFIMLLAFPFSNALKELAMLDTAPDNRRATLLSFYKSLLQKHLYCAPKGSRFLSKNAAFASWLPDLRTTFPDAKFIICIREPVAALSSQLSSLSPARSFFATDPEGILTKATFIEIFAHNYALIAKVAATAPAETFALIDQTDLKQNSAGILRRSLDQLQITLSPELEQTFAQLDTSQSGSKHRHKHDDFSIDPEQIEVCITPSYNLLLRAETRVRPDSLT